MKTYKEIVKLAEEVKLPKQSFYQIYIRVGEKAPVYDPFKIAGFEVSVVAIAIDYRGKYGFSSNKHRWVYTYTCDDCVTKNYKTILSFIFHNQK
jgi:hypothetical protein